MSIDCRRVFAGLALAAVMLSAVHPAVAFGPRIGGFGGFRGGVAGFHGVTGERFQMRQRFRTGGEFGTGDHFRRFQHGHFNSGFFGLFAPYGYTPYDNYGSYDNTPLYGLGAGYNVSVMTTGSAAASSAYADDSASSGNCVLYKLRYNYRGRYQGVTSFHPCQ